MQIDLYLIIDALTVLGIELSTIEKEDVSYRPSRRDSGRTCLLSRKRLEDADA